MDNAFSKYDELPLSVIITSGGGLIEYKNKFAYSEFKALRRGSSLYKYSDLDEIGEFVKEKTVFSKPFLVSCAKIENGEKEFYRYIFVSNFFNIGTKYASVLLLNSADYLDRVIENVKKDSSFKLSETRVFSEMQKVRESQFVLLRFLKLCEKKAGKADSVNLFDFFELLGAKLSEAKIDLSPDIPKFLSVSFNLYDLAFVAVNLIYFISHFDKTESVFVTANKKQGDIEICFEFDDKKGLVTHFNAFLAEEEISDGLALFVPLFSAISILKLYKRKLMISKREDRTRFSFRLKSDTRLFPNSFSSGKDELQKALVSVFNDVFGE